MKGLFSFPEVQDIYWAFCQKKNMGNLSVGFPKWDQGDSIYSWFCQEGLQKIKVNLLLRNWLCNSANSVILS